MDYHDILAKSMAWRRELVVDEELGEDPIPRMIEDYYQQHPGAPRHDDPSIADKLPLDTERFDR